MSSDVSQDDRPPLMAQLAGRVRMTEGQLYTAVLGVVVVVLLSLTGLPQAHQRNGDDTLSGSSNVLEIGEAP